MSSQPEKATANGQIRLGNVDTAPGDQVTKAVACILAFASGHCDRVLPAHLAISVAILRRDRFLEKLDFVGPHEAAHANSGSTVIRMVSVH
jgi:hypothetical protein